MSCRFHLFAGRVGLPPASKVVVFFSFVGLSFEFVSARTAVVSFTTLVSLISITVLFVIPVETRIAAEPALAIPLFVKSAVPASSEAAVPVVPASAVPVVPASSEACLLYTSPSPRD